MKKFLVWLPIFLWGMQAVASDLEFELLEAQPREVYYFSTPGKLILLHGEVVTPILDNSKRKYFSIVRRNGQWRLTQLNEESYRIGMIWAQGIDATSSLNANTLNFSFDGNEFQVSGLFNQPSLTTLKDAYIYADDPSASSSTKVSSPTPLQDRLYEVVPGLKYYVETAGSLILLHGEIVTPIMDGSKKRFFMLELKGGEWVLTPITEAALRAGVVGVSQITPIAHGGGNDLTLSFVGNRLVIKNYQGVASLTTLQSSVMDGTPLTRPVISYQGTPSTDLIAGQVGGTFKVGQAGEANYQINLDLPPGVNGFTPSLNLHYDSNGGYGALGWGWSLGYENRVFRCSKSIYENGEGTQGTLRLDLRDRLCWGGKPLRLAGTRRGQVVADRDYWGLGKEYYQEDTPGLLVRSEGGSAGSPDYFMAVDKNRVTTYYGRGDTKETRQLGQNLVTISWAVDSKLDAYENLISYHYQTDSQLGSQYLSTISYGGQSESSHLYQIELDYIQNSRVRAGYLEGTRFTHDKLLKGIRIATQGITQAHYQLGYETQESLNPQSYLSFIQKCFRNGDCYPATRFDWRRNDEPLSITKEQTLNIEHFGQLELLDITGSGRSEIIFTGKSGEINYYDYLSGHEEKLPYKLGTGSGAFGEGFSYAFMSLSVENSADINGDGVPELLVNGPTLQAISTYGVISNLGANLKLDNISDFDGDGLTDIYTNGNFYNINSKGVDRSKPIINKPWGDGRVILLGDLGGDNIVDFIEYQPSRTVTIGGGKNDHTRFDAARITYQSADYKQQSSYLDIVTGGVHQYEFNNKKSLVDINGDGYSDVLITSGNRADNDTLSLKINSGKGLLGNLSFKEPFVSYLSVDVDNDGLKDLLVNLRGNEKGKGSRDWVVYLVKGTADNNTVSLQRWGRFQTVKAGSKLKAADLDGDGQVELIESVDNRNIIIYRIAEPHSQLNRLDTIKEGLGRTIKINYTPITDSQVLDYLTSTQYAGLFPNANRLPNGRYADAFPYIIPMGGTYVVSGYSESGKDGSPVQYKLKYGGPLSHQQGGGWLGFERITIEGLRDNSRQVLDYHQLPPMTGRLKNTDYSIDGKLVSRLTNTWTTQAYDLDGKTPENMVVQAGSIETRFDIATGAELATTTVAMQYDGLGNLLKRQETTGSRTVNQIFTYKYPRFGTPLSQLTSYRSRGQWLNELIDYLEFDAKGSLTRSRQRAYTGTTVPANAPILSHEYEYSRFGHLIRLTQSDGTSSRTTRWHFSDDGRLLAGMTNPLGQKWSYRYNGVEPNTVQGQVVAITEQDPNGLIYDKRFDLDGRLIGERQPGQPQRRLTYTLCGSCPQMARFAITTEMAGAPTQTTYFSQDGLTLESRTDGFDGTPVIESKAYDWRGNLIVHSKPEYGGNGYDVRYAYDPLGRMSQKEDETALGTAISRWEYTGLNRLITNPKGQTRYEEYDANGLLLAVTDALGGITRYAYDAKGNLIRTLPNSNEQAAMTQEFDAWGRRVALNDASKGTWRYHYNVFGELIEQQDGKGQQTRFRYDALGRLVSRTHPEAIDCFSYDTAAHGIGQLARQTRFASGSCDQGLVSSSYTQNYLYDEQGRQTAQEAKFKGQTLAMSYRYDGYGRLSQTRYPEADGRLLAVSQRYNQSGYLSELVDETGQQLIQRIDRMDATGKVLQETLGNQVVINRNYVAGSDLLRDASSRLGGRQLLDQHYEYDQGDNLIERSHQIAFSPLSYTRVEERFEYDALNRLLGVEQSSQGKWQQSERYSYDPLGNLLSSLKLGRYTYDPAKPYRLIQVGSKRLNYDANGNVVSDGERALTYAGDDRPTSITKGQESTRFAYGPEEARYWRQDVRVRDGKSTTLDTYYFGKVYEKQVRSGNEGALTEHRYYVGPLTLVLRSNQSEDRLYQHLDHQGSVILISDQKGEVAQAFAYSGFGEQRQLMRASRFAALLAPARRGYTGHEMIDGLGLIHMNGRIYDPALGRFLQADPYVPDPSDGQSFNRYAYVRNNPLNAVDPSGFWDIGTCAADIRNDNSGRDYSGKNSPESICRGNSPNYKAEKQGGSWRAVPKNNREDINKPKEVERGFWSTTAHAILAGLGAVPVLGAVPDLFDAGFYAIERDVTGTALAMASAGASITPGLDQAAAGAKIAHLGIVGVKATETTATAAKIATKAEEAAGVANVAGKKIPNCELCGPPNKRGNAPIGNDGYPVELHHRNQNPNGPIDEMTRSDHRLGDNFKKNHNNTGQEASQIDRSSWRKEQKDYWKNEWDSGRFDDM